MLDENYFRTTFPGNFVSKDRRRKEWLKVVTLKDNSSVEVLPEQILLLFSTRVTG